MARITAVIVTYDEEPSVVRDALDSLLAQTRAPEEILVMGNGEPGRVSELVRGYPASVSPVECGANLGYIALNRAARQARGEYLACMNPDATAHEDCLEQLAAALDSDAHAAIAGAQILLDDGRTRNAGANPLHPTGISPSGGHGQPREYGTPREVIVVSGACFLARRDAFLALGGFVEEFFLYYDDVNLSWRARIAGMGVLYCPEAVIEHSYEFDARESKWFLLERNRLFSVLANYQLRTLLLLAPLLLATEMGLLVVAARGRWLGAKLRAYASLLGLGGRLMSERRAVAASRRCSDAELMRFFDDRLDSALLPRTATAFANLFCVPYMALVRRALR